MKTTPSIAGNCREHADRADLLDHPVGLRHDHGAGHGSEPGDDQGEDRRDADRDRARLVTERRPVEIRTAITARDSAGANSQFPSRRA